MLSETVYTRITNIYIITKNQQNIKQYIKMLIVFCTSYTLLHGQHLTSYMYYRADMIKQVQMFVFLITEVSFMNAIY